MATLPTCIRLITDLSKESSYGSAISDGSLINMFQLVNPDLPEVTLDTVDDQAFIKGHEFLSDDSLHRILFQNVSFNLSGVPLSCEFLGWLMAGGMGSMTSAQVGSTGDYSHIGKLQDKCTSDQLPSRTLGLVWSGSSAVSKKYKGCVVDSFTIRVTEKGFCTADVSFITDGTEASGASISVPAAFHGANWLFGVDNTLKYANFGASLVDNSTKFAGMEITVNNNHLVDEAKNQSLKTVTSLSELRMGDRSIDISLTLYVDESDQSYIDALAQTRKVIELEVESPAQLSGGTTTQMNILIPQAIWNLTGKGFDGTKRTCTFNHTIFYDATQGTPLKISTKTRDTAYL